MCFVRFRLRGRAGFRFSRDRLFVSVPDGHGWVVWICKARTFRVFTPTARFRAFAPKIGKFRAFAQQHSGGDVGVCAGVCGCLRVSCVVGGSRTVVRGAGRGDASGARSGGVSKNVLLKKSMIWPAASEQSAARGRPAGSPNPMYRGAGSPDIDAIPPPKRARFRAFDTAQTFRHVNMISRICSETGKISRTTHPWHNDLGPRESSATHRLRTLG